MIRGTSVRTGDYTMRYGRVSQRALLDCTSSRRSMVMRALPRLGVVTTEYQDDSSSKRPRSSAVFAATSRWTERVPRVGWGLQGCAPTGRRLRRPWIPRPTRSEGELASQRTLAGQGQTRIERPGLDKRSFHISVVSTN